MLANPYRQNMLSGQLIEIDRKHGHPGKPSVSGIDPLGDD